VESGRDAGARAAIVVAAAVIQDGDRFLLTRRPDGAHLEGCWEFPGGKCEPGETLEHALRREIDEELGTLVTVGDEILCVRHAYPGCLVQIHFFACQLLGDPEARLGQEMQWVHRDRLHTLAFPEADRDLIALLCQGERPPAAESR
jgi:mutator protein MutT